MGDIDFVFALGKDERLLRRLNEMGDAETCTTGKAGTDAKWRVEKKDAGKVLAALAAAT